MNWWQIQILSILIFFGNELFPRLAAGDDLTTAFLHAMAALFGSDLLLQQSVVGLATQFNRNGSPQKVAPNK